MQATINKSSAGYSPAPSDNSFQSASVFFLLIFIYLAYSRVPEFLPFPGVALTTSVLGLIFALLTGNLMQGVRSRLGIVLLVFTAWVCVGVPFSVWPGGAFHYITDLWLRAMLVFFIIASFATLRDCRRAIYALAFATATILVLVLRYGSMQDGRLLLGIGTLHNSNDLALYLLAGAPFCLYVLIRSNKALKVFWVGTLAVIPLDILKTGSRGALIAIFVGLVYVFAKSKAFQRVIMLAVAGAGLAVMLAIVPGDTLKRYSTMFGSSDTQSPNEAIASTESRMRLFKTSLIVTLKHPVFGVGMGQFPVAGSGEARATFGIKDWHVTHNMYTQVSSELGIPGFILYVSLLGMAFRAVGRVMRYAKDNPELSDAYRLAFAVRVSWLTFMVSGIFGSIAFSVPLLILLGLSEVLRRSVLPQDVVGNRAPLNPRRPVSASPRLPFQPTTTHHAGMPMLRSKHRAT